MGIRSLALLATAFVPACVSSPDVPDPGSGTPEEQVYPDVLLNWGTAGGEFHTCRSDLPPCEVPLEAPCDTTDEPEPLAVLGEPDGVAYPLGRDGRLDVGIHCGAITEARPLIIHTADDPEEFADVFVSLDGIQFTWVGELAATKHEFDLTTYHVHSARYVRVFDTSMEGSTVSIDSIEGAWSGSPQ